MSIHHFVTSGLAYGSKKQQVSMFKRLAASDQWEDVANYAFHAVCERGLDMDLIKTFTEDPHVNINTISDNGAAIHIAVKNGRHDVLRILLNSPKLKINAFDPERFYTSLQIAIADNHHVCMDLLLGDPRVDVNVKTIDDRRFTPLQLAITHNQFHLVNKLLVHPKLEINTRDADGDTALHIACVLGPELITRILAVKGVDINAVDNANETPLHYLAKAQQDTTSYLSMFLDYEHLQTNIVSTNNIYGTALHYFLRKKQNGRYNFTDLHALFKLIERTDLYIKDKYELTPLGVFINDHAVKAKFFYDDPFFIPFINQMTRLTCPIDELLGKINFANVNQYYVKTIYWIRTTITLFSTVNKKRKTCPVSMLNPDLIRLIVQRIDRFDRSPIVNFPPITVQATEALMAMVAINPVTGEII